MGQELDVPRIDLVPEAGGRIPQHTIKHLRFLDVVLLSAKASTEFDIEGGLHLGLVLVQAFVVTERRAVITMHHEGRP